MVLVGLVVVLGVVAFRTTGKPTAKPVAVTATPSPTADASADEVKTFIREYIAAEEKSAATGDATPLDAFTVPGSQAAGNEGILVRDSRDFHTNFMASRIDYIDASWKIDAFATSASASCEFRLFGHDAQWPSLQPTGPDRETQVWSRHFELVKTGGKWLIDSD